ncbi:MAG: NAD/NADP octopine/nopaline dehydrogenase family protein [Bacteroidales bacterium]|nr:NAD/NADP octopine/nopaline dehydrogenase family protein [Bacteroidales bacterium]
MKRKRITVIGAGNGGQAMAGFLAMTGHAVNLYTRSASNYLITSRKNKITLKGAIAGVGVVSCITDNIEMAIKGSEIILIATTADVHKIIAQQIAPHISPNQIIVLNPGRTFGAIEVRVELERLSQSAKDVVIGEAQSLVYACRASEFGTVNIIGKKDKVLIAAYPRKDNKAVMNVMNELFDCFEEADSVLTTSLENIGAIFHPSVVLFNAAAIERGNDFFFYNDMTPAIADFLLCIDEERLNVGKALGLKLMGIEKWVSYAYPNIQGSDLCEKMRNNPAYFKILAPKSIGSRLITEDVPTGLVPISQVGDFVGVSTSLMKSVIHICSSLVGINFWKTGRNIDSLGLTNKSKNQFFNQL